MVVRCALTVSAENYEKVRKMNCYSFLSEKGKRIEKNIALSEMVFSPFLVAGSGWVPFQGAPEPARRHFVEVTALEILSFVLHCNTSRVEPVHLMDICRKSTRGVK
jgi:hypothetical protein